MSGRTVSLRAFPSVPFQALLAVVLTALMALAATAPLAHAADGFRHEGLDGDAEGFETWLKANFKATPKSFSQALTNGRRLMKAGKDLRGAARWFSLAVVAKPAAREGWQGLAEALLALPQNQLSGSERYRLPVNASAAAYRAHRTAQGDEARAHTLVLLSQALQRRSYWRPAIDAMRHSLAIREDDKTREALQQLVAVHGFRITNYRVENETEAPRLCISFSEPLNGGDVSDFIAIGGKPAERVNVAGNQLCVSGFTHGKSYEVLVRAGLASREAEVLQKNAELQIYVRDRSPAVRFTGRRYVLPSKGQRGLPIVTVNAEAVDVEIFRVGDRRLADAVMKGDLSRQLNRWSLSELANKKGQRVYKGQLKVRSQLNEEVTSAIPVGEALEVLEAGVYAAVAWADARTLETGQELATQWFIVSDLGLTAYKGSDGVHAFVRSLATAAPTEGARVSLVARNNEVLSDAVTTSGGYARFEAGLVRGEGGLEPAVMVVRGQDGDYAFLDLTSGAFDLSDRGVEGRQAPGPVDGFIYLDRGVYRPGEEVQISALVRNAKGRAAEAPVTLIVRRPDGVEHRRILMSGGELGGFSQVLSLDDGAMTGTWRLALHVDPAQAAISQSAFQVEDFVPERLALDLTAKSAFVAPGTPGQVAVSGRYLYGPPAADLAIEGDVIVRPDPAGLKAYPDYSFGLVDQQITPARDAIGDAGRTGSDGTAEIAVRLPAIERTARPLKALVQLRLKEPGGRVIERSVSMPVRTGEERIGIKPLFKGGALGEGEPARFDIIAIDGDNRRVSMAGLKWELVRLNRSWQWYKRDGAWQYEAITIPEKIGEGSFDAGAEHPYGIEQAVTWGRYRLDVSRVDGALIASSVMFNAGWHQSDGDADSPEMLAVALDKESYRPDETAKLKIQSKTPGKAMIAIFANGLVSARDVALGAGNSEIEIPVDPVWGTGAYVVTTLYRSLDETTRRMPGRAIGVAWLGLDQGARTLNVTLAAPKKIRSGTKLTVPVRVDGVGEGGQARVTVAAVDVGVLNLTGFQSPAPSQWFYAQPVLGTEIRDLYGRLIDGMSAERGRLVSGGDADTSMGLKGAPPVEETVALFSGIVPVENGQATVTFDMPDFNGAVRLMAVAWSGDKVGEASQSVVVRDPVAVTATVPRFLTLGDEASLQISLHNVELEDAALTLTVARTYQGGKPKAIAERKLSLEKGAQAAEQIVVKPERIGRVTYDVFVAGPDGLDIGRDFVFDVGAPAMDVRRHVRRELKPGEAYRLPADLVAGLVPGDARVSLAAGPGAELNVPALLAELDRYPYGCAEQTISRALPLLYANDLSVDRGLTVDTALRGRIEAAIDRVFQMQDSSGGFGAWGPNSADIWLSAYVTDFLTRAKEAGYTVDARGFSQALARLKNYVAYVSDFKRGGEKRAYALYVLARNGRARIGELRYYADTRLDRFATPLAKVQIGAALAMAGDRERAERVIGSAFDDLGELGGQTLRHDYGSGLRDAAAVVALASEAKVLAGRVSALASRIGAAYVARGRTSTQEKAWLLLAARALSERADDIQLSLGAETLTGSVRLPIEPARLQAADDGAGLVLTNRGSEAAATFLTVVGRALEPEPAHESGFKIKRAYFTLHGEAVDLEAAGASLTQSDRLVVVLTVESEGPAGRVLLVDRLPAGLEIENPRLVEGGAIKSLSWFKPGLRPNHTEFRDERFVASFDFLSAGDKVRTTSVAYIVRAVTLGRFVHPAAMVEDMYRPERYARTVGGTLEIKAE
jgi:uncharacterized protein YfaS (alpha-2-macroglobulin family)